MFLFYHIKLLDVAAVLRCNEVSWHCSVSLQKSCNAKYSAAGFDAALLQVYNLIVLQNSGAVVLCCSFAAMLQCFVFLLLPCCSCSCSAVLQCCCSCAALLWNCSAKFLQCYVVVLPWWFCLTMIFFYEVTDRQTYRATARGPIGPKKLASSETRRTI